MKIPAIHSYDAGFIATNDQVVNALINFRNHARIVM